MALHTEGTSKCALDFYKQQLSISLGAVILYLHVHSVQACVFEYYSRFGIVF